MEDTHETTEQHPEARPPLSSHLHLCGRTLPRSRPRAWRSSCRGRDADSGAHARRKPVAWIVALQSSAANSGPSSCQESRQLMRRPSRSHAPSPSCFTWAFCQAGTNTPERPELCADTAGTELPQSRTYRRVGARLRALRPVGNPDHGRGRQRRNRIFMHRQHSA